MDQVWVVILTKDGDMLRRIPVYVEKEDPGRADVEALAEKIANRIRCNYVTEPA